MYSAKPLFRFLLLVTTALVLAASVSYPARADAAPAHMANGILVDSAGMTLYTFDHDPAGAGKSTCNGACAENWPPLKAAGSDTPMGDFTVITRDDASKQWAYKGKPLYLFKQDHKPGEMKGNGFKHLWQVVR